VNLAELCSKELYDQCHAIADRTPMVRLRGTPIPQNPFEDFFCGANHWHLNHTVLPDIRGRSGIWRKDSLIRKVWLYFNENSERLIDAWLRLNWKNDLRAAMTHFGSYTKLYDDFMTFFADRRERFLEQEEKAIAQMKTAGLAQGNVPKSHGGVANLLKVLTKTMIAQGSSILTIAKVQYAICIQAGIMLPNEFLTDVLVADEMMEGKA
jgi:hypothetical protein